MTKIILSSKSPRRKELMTFCGLDFISLPSNINEEDITKRILKEKSENRFEKLVIELSNEKAKVNLIKYPEDIIIGADTIVVCDDKVFGKPENHEHAFEILKYLSGKKHYVYTGVAIITKKEKINFFDKTMVEFHKYDKYMEELIKNYIKTNQAMDKAGAYGIQGSGSLFVKKIEGDFYSVMGLPISRVYREIKKILENTKMK